MPAIQDHSTQITESVTLPAPATEQDYSTPQSASLDTPMQHNVPSWISTLALNPGAMAVFNTIIAVLALFVSLYVAFRKPPTNTPPPQAPQAVQQPRPQTPQTSQPPNEAPSVTLERSIQASESSLEVIKGAVRDLQEPDAFTNETQQQLSRAVERVHV